MQYPHNQRQVLNGPFDFITDGLDCVTHPSRCIKNIATDVATGVAVIKGSISGQVPGSSGQGMVLVQSAPALPAWALPVGIGAGALALIFALKR